MNKDTIGLISALVNLTTMIPYVIAVMKGTARPSRVTWGVWVLLSWTIFLASIASGAHSTLFWLGAAALNSTLVFCLSLWRGHWEKSRLELWCLGLGLLGVLTWIITRQAFYSVYICSAVNVVAALPTMKKVWRKPKSEPIAAWSIGFIGASLNVLAIDSLRPVVFVPPLIVIAYHIPILIPMYFKKKRKKTI